MTKIILKPVKIYGDIKNGTVDAVSKGFGFVGYSKESGKFFVLNESTETGYDTYSLEEMAGRLGASIEVLQNVVATGEDAVLGEFTEETSIEATEPVVEEEAQTITQEDLEDVPGFEEVQEIEVDFKGLYMDAMEENKRLTEENMDLFKETVELTQENTNLKAELDLLKTDDGKLAELVKSKGYVLIIK